MRSSVTYQDCSAWCSQAFSGLRVTRLANFGRLVWGLLESRQAGIAGPARNLGNGHSFNANRQRLKRFLRWPTVTLSFIGVRLIPLVMRRFPAARPVSVILDTTSLVGDRIQCLTAAIPWKGRALPVAAILYRKDTIPDSQNRIEERFIQWLKRQVPAGYRICVVADRGFGRVSLFQLLQSLGVDFVIRVKHDVTVTDVTGKTTALSKRWVKTGRTKLLPDVRYRADQAVTLNLVLTRQAGAAEQWYLATSLTDATDVRHRYEQRFQIEETFKDAKHQLGLESTQVHKLARLAKLVAALLVVCVLLLWIGTKAERFRHFVDQGGRLSLLRLALSLLKHPPPQFRRSCLAALRQAQVGAAM